MAALNGHLKVVELLLEKGANVNKADTVCMRLCALVCAKHVFARVPEPVCCCSTMRLTCVGERKG